MHTVKHGFARLRKKVIEEVLLGSVLSKMADLTRPNSLKLKKEPEVYEINQNQNY